MPFRRCALLLALALPAAATPSFQLVIGVDGADELAVGGTLRCRAYLPWVFREPGAEPVRIKSALRWRVKPAGLATIDADGVLTAKKPGKIEVTVEDARELAPDRLPLGTKGHLSLRLRPPAEMDGIRLPRVAGVDHVHHFGLAWEDARLEVGLGNHRWWLHVETGDLPDGPLPWTLAHRAADSAFEDQLGKDLLTDFDLKRRRENLLRATLTITKWKDGIARGSVAFATRTGVLVDGEFVARLADRDGRLRRAAR